jgi:hypothetical protein
MASCGAAGVHGVDARSLAYKEAAGSRLPPEQTTVIKGIPCH